jgi:small subunit ribosomal protein S16
MGSNKRPFFRVVVADQRSPRDGRFIENIGKYHPLDDPSVIEIDQERALHWLRVGAQPSNQVRNLMVKAGIWEAFVKERPAAAADAPSREREQRERVSKKAKERAGAAAEVPAEAPAEVAEAPVEAPSEVTEAVQAEPEVAEATAAEAVESAQAAEPAEPADAPEAAETETPEAE